MENKKFEIKYQFRTYPLETRISEVEPIENGGHDPNTPGFNLETLIEFPLLEAVRTFNEKGIITIFSSANRKDVESGEVYITLDYNSLNAKNKKIAEDFSEIHSSHGGEQTESVKISIPTNERTTVGDVIMKYREILSKFENQT